VEARRSRRAGGARAARQYASPALFLAPEIVAVLTRPAGLSLAWLLLLAACRLPAAAPPTSERWWSDEVEKALGRAGANRGELTRALRTTPAEQRRGTAFLLAHMPERDLRSLRADFLLDNVALAYRARAAVPWGRGLPEEVFLNDVLPHANLDEAREPWRRRLFELCLPIVKDCKGPGEAAQKLNATLFGRLKVRYSTARRRPNQAPQESIEQGLASCTGLSILLCDACRSVAVPARVAGTAMWANGRGNHTWVEVWDGRWHFTGAAEPDPNGLDRAWFIGDAARATKGDPRHGIFAASYRRTGLSFPLVWAPANRDVPAVDVTDRYTARAAPEKGPEALPAEAREALVREARAYFEAAPDRQAAWRFDAKFDRWLAADEAAVRQAVWQAHREADIHAAAKKDFLANQVQHAAYRSPYTMKRVGKRPKGGWPLFIAMHGGGGVPKAINDSQWKVMQIYYRDQPSVPGYLYVALRAPNDAWNGFYADYVPPLIVNLIRQFVLFGEVDPDRVYLMGYSHGGYGAFFVGPKIPDRFAAVHASAAAPTARTISPLCLRNTRFTFMIGEHDKAYGRIGLCKAFNASVEKLQKENKGDFPVRMELMKGHGHTRLPDRDKIKDLYPHTRNAVPRHLTWEMTDAHIDRFFWLGVPKPAPGQRVDALLEDNTLTLTLRGVKQVEVGLDSRLVRFDRPLTVRLDGKARAVPIRPSLLTLCRSLRERGDPGLAYTCSVPLP
jgi:predicted esterase